jgi:hypothetical protein
MPIKQKAIVEMVGSFIACAFFPQRIPAMAMPWSGGIGTLVSNSLL